MVFGSGDWWYFPKRVVILTIKNMGIFLMYEGLQSTITESQVLSHIKSMCSYGVYIELWTFATNKELFQNSQNKLFEMAHYGVPIKLFRGIWQSVPFSEVLNAVLLLKHMKKERAYPQFIHCRTEYAGSIASLVKAIRNFRLIWDSRGASEAEFRFNKTERTGIKKLLNPVILWSLKRNIKTVNQKADAAIFVSDALKSLHCGDRLLEKSEIIPCAVDANLFSFSPELREVTRGALDIKPSEILVLYSGSLAPWQCFSQTATLVADLLQLHPFLKAIILTPDEKAARSYFTVFDSKRLIFKSVRMPEMNAYLNAADFGIFLREANLINHVASPVKFGEYCLAGLPIIMTNAVEQSIKISSILGNGIMYDFKEKLNLPSPFPFEKRFQVAHKARSLLSRDAFIEKYLRLYGIEKGPNQLRRNI